MIKYGFDEELEAHLNPKEFDKIALEVAQQMPEYKTFIKKLYGSKETGKNKGDPATKYKNIKLKRCNKKKIREAVKQDIDRRVIQKCLFNYKITAAFLKVNKNILQHKLNSRS